MFQTMSCLPATPFSPMFIGGIICLPIAVAWVVYDMALPTDKF